MKEKLILLILLSLLAMPLAQATYSIGVQPSIININLSPNYPSIVLPLKVWNSGDEDVNFTVEVSSNLYEFTTFRNETILVPARSNVTYNYKEVTITFTKSSGTKFVNGTIAVYAKPSGGTVAVLTRVLVKVNINQTDTLASEPYSFPVSQNTTAVNPTTTTTNTGGGGGGGNIFFLTIAVVISAIILILALKMLQII